MRISNPELLKSFAGSGFLKGLIILQSPTRCCPELLPRESGILEQEDTIARIDHHKDVPHGETRAPWLYRRIRVRCTDFSMENRT
jgi:hypothetical protein